MKRGSGDDSPLCGMGPAHGEGGTRRADNTCLLPEGLQASVVSHPSCYRGCVLRRFEVFPFLTWDVSLSFLRTLVAPVGAQLSHFKWMTW